MAYWSAAGYACFGLHLWLLVRSRDTVDRRIVNLQLTAAGREAALRITEVAPHVLNAWLRSFSKAEFDELHRLLNKLINS